MPSEMDDEEEEMAGNYLLTQRRRTSSLPPQPMTTDKPDPAKAKKLGAMLRKPGQ